jgi:hypothetical protein
MILHKDHLGKEITTKEKDQMFHTKEIRNSMALSLIQMHHSWWASVEQIFQQLTR